MKLIIFPEGTRRNNGEINAFKKGAFHIAIRSQLPIIPVVFSSYYYFLSNEEKRFDSGKSFFYINIKFYLCVKINIKIQIINWLFLGRVIVEALPAISTEGLTLDDINKLLEKTRNTMIDTFNKISKEVQSWSIFNTFGW